MPGETSADVNGHGTHVAGIVASRTYGVSKSARLIAVKVLDRSLRTDWSRVLRALQWIATQVQTSRRPSIIKYVAFSSEHQLPSNLLIPRANQVL